MVITILDISAGLSSVYSSFLNTLPSWAQNFINLFLLVLFVFLYAVFIWKFYRFLAKKNILGLNLNKYNKSENPVFAKIIAAGFYFLEYIIILPFLIFFWFSIFTLFLIVLTNDVNISTILIISATIIAAVRMSSYYKEDIAKEIAKMLPFMLLAVSLLSPGFFDFQRIIEQLSLIGGFFENIFHYLIFIIILEIILRIFDFIFSLIGFQKGNEHLDK